MLALITAIVVSAVLPTRLQAAPVQTTSLHVHAASLQTLRHAAPQLQRLQVTTDPNEPGSCISDAGAVSPNATGAGCVVNIAPAEAFNALGAQHTVTFTCGNSAADLSLSAGTLGALPGGCYNVIASVMDITNGVAATFDSATCGNAHVGITTSTVDCSSVQNPICPSGYAGVVGGSCLPVPCPSGFVLSGTVCKGTPTGDACPSNSSPVTNSGGSIVYCVAAVSNSPTSENQVVLTINSSAPHVYYIQVTGYVGTLSGGTCPQGTTLENSVPLRAPNGSVTVVAAACKFGVRAQKKYIEATNLRILPIGQCTGDLIARVNNVDFVSPCFFKVKATGMVVLKTGVNCSNGTEPTTGQSAIPAGFLPDPDTTLQPVYQCLGNVLSVINVGVPGIQLNLATNNGTFNPLCIPVSRALALLTTPTPTPTISPTATETPLPTDTPVPGTPTLTPTPIATPSPYRQSAACTASPFASGLMHIAANPVGLAGSQNVDVAASIVAPPVPGGDVVLNGTLNLGSFAAQGFPMFGTIYYPTGTSFCDAGRTDVLGNATCRQHPTPIDGLQFPQYVPTDISFVSNCEEFGIHTYFVDPGISPPGAAYHFNDPFCVIPTAFGTLSVQATFSSTINTQPPLTTGNVQLGQVLYATASPTPATLVPTPTVVATDVSTSTPTPGVGTGSTSVAGTETPVVSASTPTDIPTATSVPVPTATPTATPIPPLRFNVDAARITRPKYESKRQGIDQLVPGEKTSLVVYYTIKSLPKSVKRVTRYQIRDASGHMIFDVPFPPGTEDKAGQFARYTSYAVPSSLPYGMYFYRATLTLGKRSQGRTWVFAVVRGSAAVSVRTRLVETAY